MYARNTLEQLLAAYINPESHNAQHHRRTDGRTDGQQAAANSRLYCVAVRSAKNLQCHFPTVPIKSQNTAYSHLVTRSTCHIRK